MKKWFWEIVSFWGTLLAALIFLAVAFALDQRFGLVAFANVALITFASNTWKVFFFKARPDNPERLRPDRPFNPIGLWHFLSVKNTIAYFRYVDAGSFPSIHSARSFNYALLFAWFLGGGLWYLLLAGAALVAWSRVVKRRHFKTDIAAGAVLGLLLAATSIFAFLA